MQASTNCGHKCGSFPGGYLEYLHVLHHFYDTFIIIIRKTSIGDFFSTPALNFPKMSLSLWNGNLRNTIGDIVLDT